MKLTIFNVTMEDYEMYKCVARNPRGETDGTIRLYRKFLLIFIIVALEQMVWLTSMDCVTERRWLPVLFRGREETNQNHIYLRDWSLVARHIWLIFGRPCGQRSNISVVILLLAAACTFIASVESFETKLKEKRRTNKNS